MFKIKTKTNLLKLNNLKFLSKLINVFILF